MIGSSNPANWDLSRHVFVGNGLARSVGEAAFAEANVMKTVGYFKKLTLFQ